MLRISCCQFHFDLARGLRHQGEGQSHASLLIARCPVWWPGHITSVKSASAALVIRVPPALRREQKDSCLSVPVLL